MHVSIIYVTAVVFLLLLFVVISSRHCHCHCFFVIRALQFLLHSVFTILSLQFSSNVFFHKFFIVLHFPFA